METKNQSAPVVNLMPKKEISYNVLGQEVKLSADIVRNYLTKGNGNVTIQEIAQFINICKYQQLNPFLNEAYLVKFANNRGGEDTAQIIVSKEAFMKRAEGSEQYKGFRAGLILKRGTEVVQEEGAFMIDGDVLLGGWAEVFRSDRQYPIIAKVSLKDYDKSRSTWNQIKCTMIRKVALTQALREAFPAQLGAMYTQEESVDIQDVNFEDVTEKHIAANANALELPEEAPAEPAPALKPVEAEQPKQEGMPSVFNI